MKAELVWNPKVEQVTKHEYLKVNLGEGKETVLDFMTETCLFLFAIVGGRGTPKTNRNRREHLKPEMNQLISCFCCRTQIPRVERKFGESHVWDSQQKTTKIGIWNRYRTLTGRRIPKRSSWIPVPKTCLRVKCRKTTFTDAFRVLGNVVK